ncbi:MAG: F0F1 ATP synthase subunit B' [Rhizomicrobium sp.]
MPLKAGTAPPPGSEGGFPPFATHTFPSQIFWLAITFALLLIFVWAVVVPRIGGTIAERKRRIADALAKAEHDRREAEETWTSYQNAIVEARQRARAMIEETRSHVRADVERTEKSAESEAHAALAGAEARLAALRAEAREHIRRAAAEAAAEIVARLIGETVPPEEAAAAVAGVTAT